MFAHFLSECELVRVLLPADPGADSLLDEVSGRGDQVEPGNLSEGGRVRKTEDCSVKYLLEVEAVVDPGELLLPLPVPGPLVTPADQPVESLQAGLELLPPPGVADDGGREEGQPGDPLHRQHQEGVEGEGLAGLGLSGLDSG